jgi:hypothetical protein
MTQVISCGSYFSRNSKVIIKPRPGVELGVFATLRRNLKILTKKTRVFNVDPVYLGLGTSSLSILF